MATEEERHQKLEQIAARLHKAEEVDRERAFHYAELAASERREAERWPECSMHRIFHAQRAEQLAQAAAQWADHAGWSARLAEKLRQRANVHRANQGETCSQPDLGR